MDFNIENYKDYLILAPMAGVSDLAFRRICFENGADCVVSEMISAKAISYGDKKSMELAKGDDGITPFIIQLFGSEIAAIEYAVKKICELEPAAIDINMGCPAPKIAGNGEGAALMKNPLLAGSIIKAAVKAADCPVTVKIRSGWDNNSINAVEIAKIAEENGAAAITVHARTRAQGYEGKADIGIIAEVKNALKIAVVGNGDVTSFESYNNMKSTTNCDSVMIGRGALGAPWIFNEIKAKRKNKNFSTPSGNDLKKIIKRHLLLIIENKGERSAVLEMRKHMAWYIKGIENAASIRQEVFKINTPFKLLDFIENLAI